jgi:lipopolysaccharide export system protein LptA
MRPSAHRARAALAAATLILPLVWLSDLAAAQSRPGNDTRGTSRSTTSNVPNAVQGFSKNRNQPIQIEASSLEVHDKSKLATFRGKVHVRQGDTELRCNTLVVYYEDEAAGGTDGSRSGAAAAEPQRIKRLEAKGNVVVSQKEQTATGETGIFDMRKNTITLRGNVVVSQGRNVLSGDRLVVDMTTAVSHLESDRGPVRGLFQPSTRGDEPRGSGPSLVPRLR